MCIMLLHKKTCLKRINAQLIVGPHGFSICCIHCLTVGSNDVHSEASN